VWALLFKNYCTATSMNNVIGCVVRNVMSGTVPRNARWCERQEAIYMWMSLVGIVQPSDRNCTYGGTFSINCKEFSNFFKYS
jgi:hypothetical protein